MKTKKAKKLIPETILVQVFQKDIEQGKSGESQECPIALAVARKLNFKSPKGRVSVLGRGHFTDWPGSTTLIPEPGLVLIKFLSGSLVPYILPAEASDWLYEFDDGFTKSKPIKFKISLHGGVDFNNVEA